MTVGCGGGPGGAAGIAYTQQIKASARCTAYLTVGECQFVCVNEPVPSPHTGTLPSNGIANCFIAALQCLIGIVQRWLMLRSAPIGLLRHLH